MSNDTNQANNFEIPPVLFMIELFKIYASAVMVQSLSLAKFSWHDPAGWIIFAMSTFFVWLFIHGLVARVPAYILRKAAEYKSPTSGLEDVMNAGPKHIIPRLRKDMTACFLGMTMVAIQISIIAGSARALLLGALCFACSYVVIQPSKKMEPVVENGSVGNHF